MYHISLYFDVKTEARMREYIRKVATATGNSYMLNANVPPHITFATFEVLQKEFSVFQGNAIRMGLAKMNPHKEIV